MPFMNQADTGFRWTCAARFRSGLPSPLRSITALILQSGSAACEGFKNTALTMFVPFIYQTDSQPLVCCHKRSGLPSPLKSPTPRFSSRCRQPDSDSGLPSAQGCAIHVPDAEPPVCVLPHEVSPAVAIEVASADDFPAGVDRNRIQEFTALSGLCRSCTRPRASRLCAAIRGRACVAVDVCGRHDAPRGVDTSGNYGQSGHCRRPVHRPDGEIPVVVLPDNVGSQVAGEVGLAGCRVGVGGGGGGGGGGPPGEPPVALTQAAARVVARNQWRSSAATPLARS